MVTKTKVLIVEDEVMTAEEIRNSLEDMGYKVTSAVISGEEAIQNC